MGHEGGRRGIPLAIAAAVLLLAACVAAVAAADPGDAPSSTGTPSISGQPQVGQLLTASPGSWSGAAPISYAYQWQRCDEADDGCQDIASATDGSYRLRSADLDKTLRVSVTATNAAGSSDAQSAATARVGAGGAYPAAVLDTPNLAHYWRLGEATGATLFDSAGSAGHPRSVTLSRHAPRDYGNMSWSAAPRLSGTQHVFVHSAHGDHGFYPACGKFKLDPARGQAIIGDIPESIRRTLSPSDVTCAAGTDQVVTQPTTLMMNLASLTLDWSCWGGKLGSAEASPGAPLIQSAAPLARPMCEQTARHIHE